MFGGSHVPQFQSKIPGLDQLALVFVEAPQVVDRVKRRRVLWTPPGQVAL
jgi:hypothetical protein